MRRTYLNLFVILPLAVVTTLTTLCLTVFEWFELITFDPLDRHWTELAARLSMSILFGITAWRTPSERFYDWLSPRSAKRILWIIAGLLLLTAIQQSWNFWMG